MLSQLISLRFDILNKEDLRLHFSKYPICKLWGVVGLSKLKKKQSLHVIAFHLPISQILSFANKYVLIAN